MSYAFGNSWCNMWYDKPIPSMKCCKPSGCDGTFVSSTEFIGREDCKDTAIIHNKCDTCDYHIREFEIIKSGGDDSNMILIVVFKVDAPDQETFLDIFSVNY